MLRPIHQGYHTTSLHVSNRVQLACKTLLSEHPWDQAGKRSRRAPFNMEDTASSRCPLCERGNYPVVSGDLRENVGANRRGRGVRAVLVDELDLEVRRGGEQCNRALDGRGNCRA